MLDHNCLLAIWLSTETGANIASDRKQMAPTPTKEHAYFGATQVPELSTRIFAL